MRRLLFRYWCSHSTSIVGCSTAQGKPFKDTPLMLIPFAPRRSEFSRMPRLVLCTVIVRTAMLPMTANEASPCVAPCVALLTVKVNDVPAPTR
jgi:hypothetical protein